MASPNRRTRSACMLVAFALSLLSQRAVQASIVVGAMHHYIEPGRTAIDKQIHNTGDATTYVRVDIAELDPSGHEKKDAQHTEDLLVSPSRLIIPPGGRQTVRILSLGERRQERYFRVRFVPVPPTKAHGFVVSKEATDAFNASLGTSIKVLIGYGVMVVAAPGQARLDTRVHLQPERETIHNAGNTSLLVHDHYRCAKANDRCEPPGFARIAPGQTMNINSSATHYHKLELQEGAQRRRLVIGK
jgi:P pilus assembly chaperone PapD